MKAGRAALALLAAASLAGCAAIPPAVVNATAGIASAGASVFELGRLTFAEALPPDHVDEAAHAAMLDLGYEALSRRDMTRSVSRLYRDERGSKVRVTVRRHTPVLARVQIDVGIFGPEAVARLVQQQIRARLYPEAFTHEGAAAPDQPDPQPNHKPDAEDTP